MLYEIIKYVNHKHSSAFVAFGPPALWSHPIKKKMKIHHQYQFIYIHVFRNIVILNQSRELSPMIHR